MDELQQINIDLNALKSGKIDEFSYLTSLGKQIEIMIRLMFGSRGLGALSGRVKGTRSQVDKFMKALRGEKKYADAYIRNGLSDPRTLKTRYSLERAISNFEKETGIKWPLK
jgi:hypothetical protein